MRSCKNGQFLNTCCGCGGLLKTNVKLIAFMQIILQRANRVYIDTRIMVPNRGVL